MATETETIFRADREADQILAAYRQTPDKDRESFIRGIVHGYVMREANIIHRAPDAPSGGGGDD